MAKTTTIVSIKHYYIEPFSSEYWMTIADQGPASPLCALERYVGLPPYLGQPWAQRPWWSIANNIRCSTFSSRRNGVWSLADPAQTSFLLSWFNTSSERIIHSKNLTDPWHQIVFSKSKIPDSFLFLRLLEEKVVQFFFDCCFTFRGVQKCRWYVSYHWRQGAKPNIAVKSAQSDSCSNEKELQQAHLTVERTTTKPLESIEQHHKNRTSRSLHDNENIWKMKSSI